LLPCLKMEKPKGTIKLLPQSQIRDLKTAGKDD
jgi:hypothetical protein